MDLTTAILLAWITACAHVEHVDPAFAAAVFHVESRTATQEFRFGPMGRRGQYIGPAGIDKCFRDKYDIDCWPVNVLVGVRALRAHRRERTERAILRRYNANFNQAYYRAVMVAKKKYRKEMVQCLAK